MTFDKRPAARRRTMVAAVTAAAIGATVLAQVYLTGPEAGAEVAKPAAGPGPSLGRGEHTVTLVTGDRVTVDGSGSPRIEPAEGREKIAFSTSLVGGHLTVIPADAAPLLRTGKVDRRLFDVTELVRTGYSDERDPVRLIVGYRSAGAPVKRAIGRVGAQVTRELPAVRGAAVRVTTTRTQGLWESLTDDAGVRKIWLDGVSRPALDVSVPKIGAPAAWAAGHTGKGMTVAVLDSAVDAKHPDLAGRVTAKNFIEGVEPPAGGEAHGTHVASTIAGNGTSSGGKHRGVAPEAEILSAVVCDDAGCPDSALLAAMKWAAADRKARVINMSIRQPDTTGEGPLEEAVNRLTAETGALFVLCAGNQGKNGDGTVEAASTADAALSVGAVDDQDQLADFSSRGPRMGDAAIKPDITAPGVGIVAARASGVKGSAQPGVPDGYLSMNGTSMAAPHVSGAAALLAQAHPDWPAARLKAALMASAQPNETLGAFAQGAGRVDVARALGQTVVTDPPSVSFGLAKWPHTKDIEMPKTVTYRNDGDKAVTLKLALGGDTGAFQLGAETVEVPAGGTKAVPVAVKLPASAENKAYTARVTATAGDQRVVTPLAVVKETERYAVTVHHVGLDGKPTPDYLLNLYEYGTSIWPFDEPYDRSGTVTVRMPKGRYTLSTRIDTSAGRDGSQTALFFQPSLEVTDHDVEITLDARQAKTVAQHVPEPGAEAAQAAVKVQMNIDGEPLSFGEEAKNFEAFRIGEVGTRSGVTDVVGSVSSRWLRPGSEEDSPYAYYVADRVPGDQLLAGYDRRYSAAEFATETQAVRPAGAGLSAEQLVMANPRDPRAAAVSDGLWFTSEIRIGSADRVNHYGAGDFSWDISTWYRQGEGPTAKLSAEFAQAPRVYQPGERTNQVWGQAPFSPVMVDGASTRHEDQMFVLLPQSGDAAGHSGAFELANGGTKVFRGDELLGESRYRQVSLDGLPDAAADYRVEQTSQGGFGGLATRTSTTIGFRSARPDGEAEEPLPLVTVHFGAPAAGKLPVALRNTVGAPVEAKDLAVEVSFDDGKTWTAAPVDGGAAAVDPPAGTDFVSLRARATSAVGSTVEQTVIRAYRPE